MLNDNEKIEKIRKFFASNLFMGISFIAAACVNVCADFVPEYSAQVAGCYIFGILLIFMFIVCEDILSIMYPAVLVSLF